MKKQENNKRIFSIDIGNTSYEEVMEIIKEFEKNKGK